MSVLRGPSFRLTFDTLVQAKVQAHNEYGYGLISDANTDVNGAKIQTEPVDVKNVRRGAGTSESQIQVDWDPLTTFADVRGPSIVSYHLQWDAGTSGAFWLDLIGNNAFYTSTTFTFSYGLTAGNIYNFRVRALNLWGWGAYSQIATIKASTAPQAISTITTSIDASNGGVAV